MTEINEDDTLFIFDGDEYVPVAEVVSVSKDVFGRIVIDTNPIDQEPTVDHTPGGD